MNKVNQANNDNNTAVILKTEDGTQIGFLNIDSKISPADVEVLLADDCAILKAVINDGIAERYVKQPAKSLGLDKYKTA